jgi:thioredoxin reductase (NADPH)
MVQRLTSYGQPEWVERNSILFSQSDRLVDFFVVLEGKLELCQQRGKASSELELMIVDNQFSGELDLLNDRPSLLTCRAVKKTTVLRIRRESIRLLMRAEGDIAELILAEWITRHARLVDHSKGGISRCRVPRRALGAYRHEGASIPYRRQIRYLEHAGSRYRD